MKNTALVLTLTVFMAGAAVAQDGLISVKSSFDVVATANRLESALDAGGITRFARIDHAAGAQTIDQTLRPTLLILFGSPAMGTPLIQRSRSIAIDLPLKALIWEDSAGQAWLSYNAPEELARRHGITEMAEVVQLMQQALSDLAMAATQP
ncbi:MAG: DUF302 domain-containing protein [Desulfosarcina sp.]